MDALHYALLAVLVLLIFYAASTYGLFKEGGVGSQLHTDIDETISKELAQHGTFRIPLRGLTTRMTLAAT